jgi:hypothetical protein
MEGGPRDGIRRLLKSFGVQADEPILTHLARIPGDPPLRIRLILQDHTDTADAPPAL